MHIYKDPFFWAKNIGVLARDFERQMKFCQDFLQCNSSISKARFATNCKLDQIVFTPLLKNQ